MISETSKLPLNIKLVMNYVKDINRNTKGTKGTMIP